MQILIIIGKFLSVPSFKLSFQFIESCYQQNQWRQDHPGVDYTQRKRGARRHATPTGKFPALKPQQRGGKFLGRERESREGSPAVSNRERARASRVLCFLPCCPCWGRGTCPPSGCVGRAMGGEDARWGVSGPLSVAPLGLLMEKKSRKRSGLWIVSFLQQRAHF